MPEHYPAEGVRDRPDISVFAGDRPDLFRDADRQILRCGGRRCWRRSGWNGIRHRIIVHSCHRCCDTCCRLRQRTLQTASHDGMQAGTWMLFCRLWYCKL